MLRIEAFGVLLVILYCLHISIRTEAFVIHPVSNSQRQIFGNICPSMIDESIQDPPALIPTDDPKRIAVVGSGAVGCYYGSRLVEAGHDVSFIMRRDLYACRENGLDVRSVQGNLRLNKDQATWASSAEEVAGNGGPVDWIIVALKTYAISEARSLVSPLVGAHTRLLLIMNGLGVEEPFAEWFGPEKVFGCLAFICTNRGEPGIVLHTDYGHMEIGHYQDNKDELKVMADLWASSRVEVRPSDCLLLSRWRKLLWNIPFNGLAVALGGTTTDFIVQDPASRAMAVDIMTEVWETGNLDLKMQGKSYRLEDGEVEHFMKLTDNMAPYRPSTMIDYVEGSKLELEYMFGRPVERALALGTKAPNLVAIARLVEALERQRDLKAQNSV